MTICTLFLSDAFYPNVSKKLIWRRHMKIQRVFSLSSSLKNPASKSAHYLGDMMSIQLFVLLSCHLSICLWLSASASANQSANPDLLRQGTRIRPPPTSSEIGHNLTTTGCNELHIYSYVLILLPVCRKVRQTSAPDAKDFFIEKVFPSHYYRGYRQLFIINI